MEKEYRVIPGHRQYGVSSDGEVMRLEGGRRNKPLAQTKKNGSSLLYVTLQSEDYHNGVDVEDKPCMRCVGVHRLVCVTWVGPEEDGRPWVRHKDRDRTNNNFKNLEWVGIGETLRDSIKTGAYKVPKGSDHWRYGKKLSEESKRRQSLAKQGERHPRFGGWYVKDGRRYASIRQAMEATGAKRRDIKEGRDGWGFEEHRRDVLMLVATNALLDTPFNDGSEVSDPIIMVVDFGADPITAEKIKEDFVNNDKVLIINASEETEKISFQSLDEEQRPEDPATTGALLDVRKVGSNTLVFAESNHDIFSKEGFSSTIKTIEITEKEPSVAKGTPDHRFTVDEEQADQPWTCGCLYKCQQCIILEEQGKSKKDFFENNDMDYPE